MCPSCRNGHCSFCDFIPNRKATLPGILVIAQGIKGHSRVGVVPVREQRLSVLVRISGDNDYYINQECRDSGDSQSQDDADSSLFLRCCYLYRTLSSQPLPFGLLCLGFAFPLGFFNSFSLYPPCFLITTLDHFLAVLVRCKASEERFCIHIICHTVCTLKALHGILIIGFTLCLGFLAFLLGQSVLVREETFVRFLGLLLGLFAALFGVLYSLIQAYKQFFSQIFKLGFELARCKLTRSGKVAIGFIFLLRLRAQLLL